jgi:signal transduction histidine kinase
MAGKLCIFCCHNFLQEVGAGRTAEGWDDVVVAGFPARCGRPPVAWDELQALLPAECTQIIVLGRACLQGLSDPPPGFPPARIVSVAQCFHLVAGEQLVNDAIAGGGYLITPAWLADWRGQLKTLGFVPEQAAEFFQDFAKELVLLDTGIDPQATAHLADVQAATHLPVRRIAVGLDVTRLSLARWVLEWRLSQEQQTGKERSRRHASELADHVAAMDMLVRLAQTHDEAAAVATIEDLFRMLFAPAALHYLHVENGVTIPAATAQQPIPEAMRVALRELDEDYAWTADGQGFLLRIGRGGEVLGLVAVERLAFPEYRERYLNMALAITGICGLAIENARNRRRLLEAEKMASLGIVVAGVAHEINTPLGVGLTAASTLQNQSRQLASQFAERRMTQSDLDTYLQRAQEAAALIRSNLERIGQLTDAFRQVAVNNQAPVRRVFRVKDCLADVVQSLGERLSASHIALRIDCEPTLEINSLSGDWVSIFSNLIGNSLKHGFKGRAQGAIDIQITSDEHWLRLIYQDDGVGMAPETLARVFDPFFTTDMQHGMGLGMYLVYNLITQRLGGHIQCESPPGGGVRFHIEIPS